MIRLLKEHYWQEAYAGVGSIAGHVIVGDKMYVPRVRERLQYFIEAPNQDNVIAQVFPDCEYVGEREDVVYGVWKDAETVETRLPPPPDA